MSVADTPALSTLRSLPPQQIADYHRDGFLIVRGVFQADEMAALAAESDTLQSRQELVDTQNIRCRWQNDAAGECTFDTPSPCTTTCSARDSLRSRWPRRESERPEQLSMISGRLVLDRKSTD
jgi:hypothetical protein